MPPPESKKTSRTPATMTEDNRPTVSSSGSMVQTDSCTTKKRKKRKWDVPAEPLVAAGLALPGNFPLVNGVSLAGITFPGIIPVSNSPVASPLVANSTALVPGFQVPLLKQQAVALAQKLNPPKIQDELISREIVINDADSAIRYKLTKRQTQEEIQNSTGAVVITRGKYRQPNAPTVAEKPLYLHISAGSHLETTVDRIKAVDHAAAMVEEMLKGGSVKNGLKVNHLLSTCVHLGFEADPSWNISPCIRGPNDQYINHIMNETGATVLLRGRGSGSGGAKEEEAQQPLHLSLSSYNPQSLERAKLLAENLLDTISAEFGASRVSSNKVYGAVPPPPQLLTGVQCSVNESKAGNLLAVSSTVSSTGCISAYSAVASPGCSGVISPAIEQIDGGSSFMQSQPTASCYSHYPLNGGTSYNVYAGIYPQATPLQQVALALRQSASPLAATVAPVTTAADAATHTSAGSSAVIDKRPPPKRKFQELSAAVKGLASSHQHSLQGSNLQKPRELTSDIGGARHVLVMPPAKNIAQPSFDGVMMPHPEDFVFPSSNGMHPPPRRSMPPPPPKFISPPPREHENKKPCKLDSESVPDTLVKLLEYGNDDDDDESEDTREESLERNSTAQVASKPFWAV